MRVLAVLLAAAIALTGIAHDAPAKQKRRGDRRPVTVIVDHTSAGWDGIVAETVADFAPYVRLKYVRGDGSCRKRRGQDVIRVCSAPALTNAAGIAGGRMIYVSDQYLGAWYDQFREGTMCHEFMHALTGIGDNYDAEPESCVWGSLSDPGAFDIARLAG